MVGIDESEASAEAVRFAVHEGELSNARVTAAHHANCPVVVVPPAGRRQALECPAGQ